MNRQDICDHLPHAGAMCLLDRLDHWDQDTIVCLATSHRRADNPLFSAGRLRALAGIEYAAQAMALHGSLLAAPDSSPAMGYLASVRDLKMTLQDLGTVPDELRITAHRLSGDDRGFIYEFEISAGGRLLISGRAAAKLVAGQE